jgi:hypothetical protein
VIVALIIHYGMPALGGRRCDLRHTAGVESHYPFAGARPSGDAGCRRTMQRYVMRERPACQSCSALVPLISRAIDIATSSAPRARDALAALFGSMPDGPLRQPVAPRGARNFRFLSC